MRAQGDHQMVPGQTSRATPGAAALPQLVRDQNELRPPGLVVGLLVVDEHHLSVDGGQDRLAEANEDIG